MSVGGLFQQEPFRLVKMEVFNWGTFENLHVIPVAPEGFLFVGKSGTGKSTLLDAFSTILIPPGLRHYNVAAREGERTVGSDRTILTYIRGAWSENEDPALGRSVKQFLRPKATWSAISLLFSARDGRVVTLCGVFAIKTSATTAAQVKSLYMVHDEAMSIKDLAPLHADFRKIKKAFPRAFASNSFKAYAEQFKRRLHIPTDAALRLLQKAQSAKNLGDLNLFLRDFMLEEPGTFAAADALVNDFAALKDAHAAVVEIRDKIHVLRPIRDHLSRRDEALEEVFALESERRGIERFLAEKELVFLDEEYTAAALERNTLQSECVQSESREQEKWQNYQALYAQYNERGGSERALLEHRLEEMKTRYSGVRKEMAKINEACTALGVPVPSCAAEFARLVATCRDEDESESRIIEREKKEFHSLLLKQGRLDNELKETREVLGSLKKQESNIPTQQVELRRTVAAAIGCAEVDLPFAGELMEVMPEYRDWRGAIERLLRPLSLSILVDERHYRALNKYVKEHHLGRRIEYHRTNQLDKARNVNRSNTVNHRIQIREHPCLAWLRAKIGHSYNFVCAEDLNEFEREEYALTITGLYRSGKSRHVKDDRHGVDDVRSWCMGFSNHEKRARFEREEKDLCAAIEPIAHRLVELGRSDAGRSGRKVARQRILDRTWEEVDEGAVLSAIKNLEVTIAAINSEELTQLAQYRDLAKQDYDNEKAHGKSLAGRLARAENTLTDLDNRIQRNKEQVQNLLPLDDSVAIALTSRTDAMAIKPARASLQTWERKLNDSIQAEIDTVKDRIKEHEGEILKSVTKYITQWNDEEGALVSSMDGAPDFVKRLTVLEDEQLERHEDNFKNLLRTQSLQRLTALMQSLANERMNIRNRLEEVNKGLRDKQYNAGTHLQIQIQDLHLEEAARFIADGNETLSGSFDDVNRENMDERFEKLSRLVGRLQSPAVDDLSWRKKVLDVRLHVEFIGRELDDITGRPLETYRGGGGKSGGQRQKLTATCLAAALRYQLGGADGLSPVYTTVVLDEAFDKADHEFTRQAISIINSFGFQMIIATPMKAIRTMEPFIGGACVVVIQDRQRSRMHFIEYDTKNSRFHLTDDTPDIEDVEEIDVEAIQGQGGPM